MRVKLFISTTFVIATAIASSVTLMLAVPNSHPLLGVSLSIVDRYEIVQTDNISGVYVIRRPGNTDGGWYVASSSVDLQRFTGNVVHIEGKFVSTRIPARAPGFSGPDWDPPVPAVRISAITLAQ
jgi:hypothetical protein